MSSSVAYRRTMSKAAYRNVDFQLVWWCCNRNESFVFDLWSSFSFRDPSNPRTWKCQQFQPCSFTKTCSFGTYLEPGGIFSASVSSFTKTHSFTKTSSFGTSNLYWTRKLLLLLLLRFRSTTTPHFNFKCFVITKTSFRRSFGEKLYISSFGSVLRPLRTLTSSASSLQRLLSGGHL